MWPFSKKKTTAEKVGDIIKSDAPDFAHLFGNLSNRDEAVVLYKELSGMLHPDRFINAEEEIMAQAEALFKELQSSRTDIEKLRNIKNKAILFLSNH